MSAFQTKMEAPSHGAGERGIRGNGCADGYKMWKNDPVEQLEVCKGVGGREDVIMCFSADGNS